jgi:hypothetical protein
MGLQPIKPGSLKFGADAPEEKQRRLNWLKIQEKGGYINPYTKSPIYGCETEDDYVLHMYFILYGKDQPKSDKCKTIEPWTQVKYVNCKLYTLEFCEFRRVKFGWLPWGASFWTSFHAVSPNT